MSYQSHYLLCPHIFEQLFTHFEGTLEKTFFVFKVSSFLNDVQTMLLWRTIWSFWRPWAWAQIDEPVWILFELYSKRTFSELFKQLIEIAWRNICCTVYSWVQKRLDIDINSISLSKYIQISFDGRNGWGQENNIDILLIELKFEGCIFLVSFWGKFSCHKSRVILNPRLPRSWFIYFTRSVTFLLLLS